MKAFLRKHRNKIRIIKAIVAALLVAFIIIDIILVAKGSKGWPTFSRVVKLNRTSLIWLTFLYGGLVAKVFYNRKVVQKTSEVSGFFAFMSVVILLFALGRIIDVEISTAYEFLLLVCGGILAYRVWPQYTY